ncbi:MAG: HypC/HybG/HupF family hydrogenase formation chaperone [Chloroflexota bacterium]
MCLAIPGRVISLEGDGHYAMVDVSGVRRKVNIDLLAPERVAPDDWILIHVGFALSKVSEAEAQAQFTLLRALGEDVLAMEEVRGYNFDDITG